MSIREDIIAGVTFDGHYKPCTVVWNGHCYHDFNTEALVNLVIEVELDRVQFRISRLDIFNEDHAGELQELICYRDYLTGDINH